MILKILRQLSSLSKIWDFVPPSRDALTFDNGGDNVMVEKDLRSCFTFSRGRQRSSFVGVGMASRAGGPPDVLVIMMILVMIILEEMMTISSSRC